MRNPRPLAIAAMLLASLLGCRLPGTDGPVSRSLVTCRQLSQQAVTARQRGDRQQAEQLLAKAVKTCPVDSDARRYYAETLWDRGARREAIAQLEEASRLVVEDATVRVRLAEMYLALHQIDPARQNAEKAIDLNPKLPAAWAVRGRVARATGQRQQALADYHRALGYAPDDRQILLELAELHRELNQPQQALATLQHLAETYSPGEEPQEVLHLQGMAYLALHRHDDATESLSAAAARGKPTTEILSRLAEAARLAGRTDEAAALVGSRR